jgi:hypothetical protein
MKTMRFFGLGIALFIAACGSNNGNGNGIDADPSTIIDADPSTIIDADPSTLPDGAPGGCVAGGPQCNNCVDDDADGLTDGQDPECTGGADNDEDSFATGIPGDNIDTVKQDCFFDGNSGSGDDGCEIHVCCLLGASDQQSCPFGANQYDPAECDDPQVQTCIDVCGPLTPPGCDCFGCCTVCDPVTNVCVDITTNPATAPDCEQEVLDDPVLCPRCTKVADCGTPCDPENCILCPGQTEEDLPDNCNEAMCPAGLEPCGGIDESCPEGQYCSNGCCISNIE